MTREEKLERINARSWYHSIEIEPGLVTPGMHPLPELQQVLARVGFPESLAGLSVLDIGAYDGFFTFEAERRGAKRVVAYDLMPADYFGFSTARELLGSRAEYVQGSVYDLEPETAGTFDVVLFLGVLYHLRYPLLALDRIRRVCEGHLLLETHFLDNFVLLDGGRVTTLEAMDARLPDIPLYRFYRTDELNGDVSNWFAPNRRAIEDGLWSAGFAPEHLSEWHDRIVYRGWSVPGIPEYLQAGTYEGVGVADESGRVQDDGSASADVTAPVQRAPSLTCWCGGALGEAIGPHYRCCVACGTAVLTAKPAPAHFDVADDTRDFYGRRYWMEYSRARGLPDIEQRARGDLSERCLFWLARLLEVTRPPGRALEIGCAHGGFVRLMQELGFDAAGTELSPWVVEFARRNFGVSVLRGRLEALDLEPGFACIAAFDVLEHLDDPLGMVRRCAELLRPDGVLLLQTPCYRGEGPDWSMFQEDEHVHLFTDASIRLLLARAGFRDVRVEPAFFPYDMWVVATPGRLHSRPPVGEADDGWRLPAAFRSLLDVSRRATETEADRTAEICRMRETERLLHAQVVDLTNRLKESDADRAARLEQIEQLTAWLRDANADRAARLEQVDQLTASLYESEADRAARLDVIRDLEARLAAIESSRTWRFYRTVTGLATPKSRH